MSSRVLSDSLDADAILPGARFIPSANCDDRPEGEAITLIVVHAISLPPGEFGGEAIERLFTNSLDPAAHAYYRDIHALRVSAHFLIARDGALLQFVPCTKRAWHAGISHWGERERCNDFSIGIELEGCDELPFEETQYQVLAHLIQVLKRRYAIKDIVGHSDVAPGRKTDPGPNFNWHRLATLLAANAEA